MLLQPICKKYQRINETYIIRSLPFRFLPDHKFKRHLKQHDILGSQTDPFNQFFQSVIATSTQYWIMPRKKYNQLIRKTSIYFKERCVNKQKVNKPFKCVPGLITLQLQKLDQRHHRLNEKKKKVNSQQAPLHYYALCIDSSQPM